MEWTATFKEPKDLKDVEKGKRVILHFKDGEDYGGYYQGMDIDHIMVQSINNEGVIGLPFCHLQACSVEI